MDEKDKRDFRVMFYVGGIFILLILAYLVLMNEKDANTKLPINASEDALQMCSCQEACLTQKESDYCEKRDCEIYEINVPPCDGKTLIVRRTTRQKIDYVIPPSDYAECYGKCLKQNITPLMP